MVILKTSSRVYASYEGCKCVEKDQCSCNHYFSSCSCDNHNRSCPKNENQFFCFQSHNIVGDIFRPLKLIFEINTVCAMLKVS